MPSTFEPINRGYSTAFTPGQLSLGITVPISPYAIGTAPDMRRQLEYAQLAEALGFRAIWVRDIPLDVPSFGDVGQTYDPFTYLGYLAGQTRDIALGTSSIALPLRHPLHVAKSAATIDQLSGGRMILGIASGDRPQEYPAMGIAFKQRGEAFEEALAYVRAAGASFPHVSTGQFGTLDGSVDVLPKPTGTASNSSRRKLPVLVTGHSRHSEAWIAEHADGWMYYLRDPRSQAPTLARWRGQVAEHGPYDKPFMQAMYVILDDNASAPPRPIQLGFHTGVDFLNLFLRQLQAAGVNHVALNLRFNTADVERTLTTLAEHVLPNFHTVSMATQA